MKPLFWHKNQGSLWITHLQSAPRYFNSHNWANAGRRKNWLSMVGNIRITTSITIRWWFIAASVFHFICFERLQWILIFSISCKNKAHFQVNFCLNNIDLSDFAWYQQYFEILIWLRKKWFLNTIHKRNVRKTMETLKGKVIAIQPQQKRHSLIKWK